MSGQRNSKFIKKKRPQTPELETESDVASEDLFSFKDRIEMEGSLFKFIPGISHNFQERYVQISKNAFRYFKNPRH